MKAFTANLGYFIKDKGLGPVIALPYYFAGKQKSDLINLISSGLGNKSVIEVDWKKDKPFINEFLRKSRINIDNNNSIFVIKIENEKDYKRAIGHLVGLNAECVIYDLDAYCGEGYQDWIYQLKFVLIQELSKRTKDIFINDSKLKIDTSFIMTNIDDPIDVLDFFNLFIETIIDGFEGDEALRETFGKIIAAKLNSLSSDAIRILFKIIACEKEKFAVENMHIDEQISQLQGKGFLRREGNRVDFSPLLFPLRNPELLEHVIPNLSEEKFTHEVEEFYSRYMISKRPSPFDDINEMVLKEKTRLFHYNMPNIYQLRSRFFDFFKNRGFELLESDIALRDIVLDGPLLDLRRAYFLCKDDRISEASNYLDLIKPVDPDIKAIYKELFKYIIHKNISLSLYEIAEEQLAQYFQETDDQEFFYLNLGLINRTCLAG